jgi:hypothetical protein
MNSFIPGSAYLFQPINAFLKVSKLRHKFFEVGHPDVSPVRQNYIIKQSDTTVHVFCISTLQHYFVYACIATCFAAAEASSGSVHGNKTQFLMYPT